MRYRKRLLAGLAAPVFITGCATIVSGPTQQVTLVSTPPGAAVIENGIEKYTTPVTVTLKHSDTPSYVLRKDGHRDTTLTPDKGVNGWIFGNIVLGGIIGIIIDGATGNTMKFKQDTYVVALPPVDPQTEPASASSTEPKATSAAVGNTRAIAAYVRTSYDRLMQELRAGDGETLNSLYALLGVTDSQIPKARARLRALESIALDADDYAKLVATQFYSTQERVQAAVAPPFPRPAALADQQVEITQPLPTQEPARVRRR